MNTAEFNALFEETVDICRQTLCVKADEYAEGEDRLHNFNIAAAIQGETPVKSLGGMGIKHYVSIYDLIRRYEKGKKISDEMWTEKIKDGINYLILLRAALTDAHSPVSTPTTAEPVQGSIIPLPEDNACSRLVECCGTCAWYDDEICSHSKARFFGTKVVKKYLCQYYVRDVGEANQCISCGASMPEGDHVCQSCKRR